MLKSHSILEQKVGEKVAQLHLDSTFTYGEVHDILHKMLQFVVEKINEAAAASAPKAEEPKESKLDVPKEFTE